MRRSEIRLLNLDPTLGAEIKKTRPVVIVSHDSVGILPLRVIVPITHWQERYEVAPWLVKIEPSTLNAWISIERALTYRWSVDRTQIVMIVLINTDRLSSNQSFQTNNLCHEIISTISVISFF
jgi:mRNA interferase MazF